VSSLPLKPLQCREIVLVEPASRYLEAGQPSAADTGQNVAETAGKADVRQVEMSQRGQCGQQRADGGGDAAAVRRVALRRQVDDVVGETERSQLGQ